MIYVYKINDYTLPTPAKGITIKRKPSLSTQTNAKGQIVAQVINERRTLEFSGLKWNYLDAETWRKVLAEAEKNIGDFTYYDTLAEKWYKIKVLWGATQEEPYIVGSDGKPEIYINCSCDVTDMGFSRTEVSMENV